jgi:predicted transcriptional regulator
MRIPIPVRLPRDVVDWIDRQATAADEPRSVIVRRLLRDAMERQQRQTRRRPAQAHSEASTTTEA